MIHEVGKELGLRLAAQGCPVRVVDGPERTKTTTFGRERIVLEHDESGDSFGPPKGSHKNPKHRMTRTLGAKITIYAQSSAANSLEFEHRRRAEHILDLVLVGLGDVFSVRRNTYTPKSGTFIQPEDLAATEVIAGAVYELKITFDRGVFVQTWAGDAQPEGSISGLSSTTHVFGDTDPSANETACGS